MARVSMCFCLVALASLCLADPPPGQPMDEAQMHLVFDGIEQWRGHITVTWIVENHTDDGVYREHTYSDDSASATFTLDRVHSPHYSGLSWRSRPAPVRGAFVSRSHHSSATDSVELNLSASYAREAVAEDIRLDVRWLEKEGVRWDLCTGGSLSEPYTVRGTCTRRTSTVTGNTVESDVIEHSARSWPHTVVQTPLTGPMSGPSVLVGKGGFDNSHPTGQHSYRIEEKRTRVVLEPVFDDVELVVDIEDYEEWMPKGRPDGSGPGSELTAIATLEPKAGKSLPAKPVKFRFELQDTSREPGVCMNWPRLSELSGGTPKEDPEYDLRFDAADGELDGPGAQAVAVDRIEEVGGDSYRAHATIRAFDFGGYGELLVSAELAGGRVVFGRLKGGDETLISLPKRRPGSFIADVFRKKWKCEDADALDVDAEPKGDGNLGDGFPAYEEYRGFLHDGRHVRTAPDRKDLFVVNRIGDSMIEGLTCFTLATGLTVHDQTRLSELTVDRVANPNRSPRSPRTSEELQHGLLLTLRVAKDRDSQIEVTGSLWRPKYVDLVTISAAVVGEAVNLSDPNSTRTAERLASTVAHELSHAIGVRHHGNTDPRWVEFVRHTRANGEAVILEYAARADARTGEMVRGETGGILVGNQVRVLTERSGEIPPSSTFFDTPTFVYVADQGGEHSGSTECVMRYKVADWYIPANRPRDRVFFRDPHPVGFDLCPSPAAAGVWKTRFGDATRGDCKHSFAVRDDAPDVKKK